MLVKGRDADCHAEPEGQMRERDERKRETRDRILQAASTLFRRDGIDRTGVDAIMHEAGLTHGGFYAHFASKEALVAEVAAASLARSAARWEQTSQGQDGSAALARILDAYLDPRHVSAPDKGCVLTTFGADIARRPEARPEITRSVRTMLDALGRCLPATAPGGAPAALACMVGAVVLARLVDDESLAAGFLAAANDAVSGG
jgi:TetR/AcrR family transcriptional regulator, transcriptional repressor for nem operon